MKQLKLCLIVLFLFGKSLCAEQADLFSRLLSESDYETLLASQRSGEVLPVDAFPRPALGWVIEDGTIQLNQGHRRYERTPPEKWFDVFIASEKVQLIDPKKIVVWGPVSDRIVEISGLISSRGIKAERVSSVVRFIKTNSPFVRVKVSLDIVQPGHAHTARFILEVLPQFSEKYSIQNEVNHILAKINRFEQMSFMEKVQALREPLIEKYRYLWTNDDYYRLTFEDVLEIALSDRSQTHRRFRCSTIFAN